MALTTGFTELFGVRFPIVSAPMGGSAGGGLAAAVSRGGGFGMVAGGDREWLDRELPIVAGGTWGVGFLTWSATVEMVEHALDHRPAAVMLSFGDPGPFAGIAAVLALGAAGALLGTRFQATAEALVDPAIVAAIVAGRSADTERSSVLDIVRGSRWPRRYTARTLGHPYLDRWRGREDELAGDPEARQDYQRDLERGVIPPLPVWAGEGIDLITDVPSAADLVPALAAQAEAALGGEWAGP